MNNVLILVPCDEQLKTAEGIKCNPTGPIDAAVSHNGIAGLLWGEGKLGIAGQKPWLYKWIVVEVNNKDIAAVTDELVVFFRGTVKCVFDNWENAFAHVNAQKPGDRQLVCNVKYGTAWSQDNLDGFSLSSQENSNAAAVADFSNAITINTLGRSICLKPASCAMATGVDGMSFCLGSESVAFAPDGSASSIGADSWAIASCLARAGPFGMISIKWFDESSGRYRITTGYVGENGIEKDVWYGVDPRTGNLVPAEQLDKYIQEQLNIAQRDNM